MGSSPPSLKRPLTLVLETSACTEKTGMIVEGGDGDPGCEKKVGTGGSQGSPLLLLGVGPNKWIHMAHS